MKKLPTTLKLTWHKGYKKDYPKYGQVYLVMMKEGKKELVPDFSIFIPETINKINFDRFRLLANSIIIGEIYINNKHQKFQIEDWAEIKGE